MATDPDDVRFQGKTGSSRPTTKMTRLTRCGSGARATHSSRTMLPDLIEIVPLSRRTDATVVLRGALWSEDTQAMVNCLKRLGFCIEVADDPAEPANCTLTVYGYGGRIPNAGPPAQPLTLELFVENAGTAARFLPPFLCLGQGAYRRLCCPTRPAKTRATTATEMTMIAPENA